MKQTIKYRYAFDCRKNTIDITTINKNDRNSSKYYCISCGKELTAKLGDKKRHHFSHKISTDSTSCNFETYLHNLAKYKIKEIFDNDTTFNINMTEKVICSSIQNCYFSSDENCCSHSREILVNLKDRYDLCTVEKQIEGFKADILLENSNNKYKPLLIEVFVTHECSEDKINSKLPIIEISIKKEEDIQDIKEIIKSNKKTYNILPIKVYEPLEINYPFQKYALYASGKYYANYICEGTCNDIDLKKYNKALLEISVYKNQMSINSFLLYASFLGYNIRDCSICEHYKYVESYYGNYPLCLRYKKDNTPKNPNSLYAYQCEYYKINKINYQSFVSLISEYGIRIIQNQVELFNNIDLKSLYIKNINNVLKDCISQLEDSFRKKNLFIKIADRDINTSDYYNKAETLKIKEYVHCLKLYHSTKISRPPLFIYYIEANFNYPVENSNKAICIKINDKNDLQEFIYKNIVKLYRNSKICYHNIKTHKRENKPEMDLQSTYNIDALNEINQVPQLPSDYKEDVIPFLMKEFNTKNIFIERYNNVVIALKPLYNNCERSDIKENVLLKIFNNNKAICPIYIQLCFNNESPIKDMPTIVLRLDLYGKWKESKHQECLLIKEGKNGEFYKIDHLYKNNKLDL